MLSFLFFPVSSLVIQSCLTLCDPTDCNPLGSSVHGIFQARILEWVAIPFCRGIFLIQGLNLGLLHCRQILDPLSHQGRPVLLSVLLSLKPLFPVEHRECPLFLRQPLVSFPASPTHENTQGKHFKSLLRLISSGPSCEYWMTILLEEPEKVVFLGSDPCFIGWSTHPKPFDPV